MAIGYKIAEGYMKVTADHSAADRQLTGFFRAADGRLRDMRGRFAREGDLAGVEFGERLERALDRRGQMGMRGFLSRSLGLFGRFGAMAGKLFANKFALIGTAALAALPTALSLTGALAQGLAQIGSSLALLAPAAIGGLIFSMVSLKLAFSGVGDALKAGLSGDTAQFAEALKKLAPAAQEAVKQFVALAPAARELKRVVQNSFFAPWLDDIKPLAMTYLPILRQEMAILAGRAGMAVRELAKLFQTPQVVAQFTAMLREFQLTFGNIASALPGVVSGFITLAAAGSSWLTRMTVGFEGLTARFAEWSRQLVASGRFDEIVGRGLALLGQVRDTLVDIGGIFKSIFAAVPGGGGLFALFAQGADALNRFLKSAEGSAILTNFFARLQVLAGLIMDLVKGALPGLLALSDGLLRGFEILAPVAGPVGKAIGDVLAALAPLIPVLASSLAPLLRIAAGVLSMLAAELGPVIKLFSDLALQVLPILMPIIEQLFGQALPVAVELGKQLADAFAPVIPVFLEVARIVGDELMKHLPELQEIGQQLLPIVSSLAHELGQSWADALRRLTPYIPYLVEALMLFLKIIVILYTQYMAKFLTVAITLFSWFLTGASWIAAFVLSVKNLPGAIVDAASAFWGWLKGVGSAVADWFVSVGRFFSELPGKIGAALSALPGLVKQHLQQVIDQFFYMVGFISTKVILFVFDIPNKISRMWEMIKTTFMNGVAAVGRFFSELPLKAQIFFAQLWGTVTHWVSATAQSIATYLSNLPSRIGGWFSDAWARAKSATISGVNAVSSFVQSIPGKIKGVFADAGNWLYDAGRRIIQGAINGIMSMIDAVKRAANNVLRGIRDALPGSPVKEGPLRVLNNGYAGRQIARMLADGLDRGSLDVRASVHRSVAQIPALMGRSTNPGPTASFPSPTVNVGGPQVVVLLDGEEIAARVNTPGRVARTNDEGQRRRGFINTGRLATAGA